MQKTAMSGVADLMAMEYTDSGIPRLTDGCIIYEKNSLPYQIAEEQHIFKFLYKILKGG
jgi:hypothetical protein